MQLLRIVSIDSMSLFLCLLLFGVFHQSHAQDQNVIAVIPPFMDRQHTDESGSPLQMTRQRFILLLYRNAAAIYSEADFINTGDDTITAELGLPSTGYLEKNTTLFPYQSNGLLGVRLWVSGERLEPDVKYDGPIQWYTINPDFPPGGSTNLKALFWVQTSLTDVDSIAGLDTVEISDGERGLLIDVAGAAVWREAVNTIEITVMMREGLTSQDTLVVDPDNYDASDSTIGWTMHNVEPSLFDNILVKYSSGIHHVSKSDTMEKLAEYIERRGYDELLEYIDQLDEE